MTKSVICQTCGQKIKEDVKIYVRIQLNRKDFDVFTTQIGTLNFTTLPSGHEIETVIKDSRRTAR